MTAWLAFVESNTSGTGRLFAQAAIAEGFRPILLTNDSSRYAYAAEDGIDVVTVDTRDESALLTQCRRLSSESALAGVTTTSEYFVVTAADLAQTFALPAPSPAALRDCRDKRKQRVRLNKAGISVPMFRAAGSPRAAVAAAEEFGLPVVLKTAGGSGSVGVKLCESKNEVVAHATTLLRQRRNERGLPVARQILVESVVDGPEYSVETFNREVIGITRKLLGPLPFFVEVGHDYPAVLPSDTEAAICRTALRALDALGLGWGPAHIELRLGAGGPTIIEVNPRLAGGFIPELLRLSQGISLISETIKLVVGRQPDLRIRPKGYSSIRFLIPPCEGVLKGIEGVEEARRIPGVVDLKLYAKGGDTLHLRGDFRDRVGHVVACADTPEAARAAAESAHSALKLTIQPQ